MTAPDAKREEERERRIVEMALAREAYRLREEAAVGGYNERERLQFEDEARILSEFRSALASREPAAAVSEVEPDDEADIELVERGAFTLCMTEGETIGAWYVDDPDEAPARATGNTIREVVDKMRALVPLDVAAPPQDTEKSNGDA